MKAKHGTLNVHRADCRRQHTPVCEPWEVRRPKLVEVLHRMGCSTYSFEECTPQQAIDITTDLGWGTGRDPAYWTDENFNVVAADRSKWTDVEQRAVSLWAKVGDAGDEHRRSLNFVLLHRLDDTAPPVWVGAGHLETGDPDARIVQAKRLAEEWPRDGKGHLADAVLGIDRNSFTQSKGGPRDLLARAGIREALPTNPTGERSFNGFAIPDYDGKCIDGLHYSGGVKVRSAALVSTVGTGATDHSGLTLSWELA